MRANVITGLVLVGALVGCREEDHAPPPTLASVQQASEWGAPCWGNGPALDTPRCEPFQYWTSHGYEWGYMYVACVAGKEVSFAMEYACELYWDEGDTTHCEGNSLVIQVGDQPLYIAECAGFDESGHDWPAPGEPGRVCFDNQDAWSGGSVDCVVDTTPGGDGDDDDDDGDGGDDDGDPTPVPSNIIEMGDWPFGGGLVDAELEADTAHLYTIDSTSHEYIGVGAVSSEFVPHFLVRWPGGYVEEIVGREIESDRYRAFLEYALVSTGSIEVVLFTDEGEGGAYQLGGTRLE